jgi:hypothetical protein
MLIGWLIPIVIGTGNTFRQFCSRKPQVRKGSVVSVNLKKTKNRV